MKTLFNFLYVYVYIYVLCVSVLVLILFAQWFESTIKYMRALNIPCFLCFPVSFLFTKGTNKLYLLGRLCTCKQFSCSIQRFFSIRYNFLKCVKGHQVFIESELSRIIELSNDRITIRIIYLWLWPHFLIFHFFLVRNNIHIHYAHLDFIIHLIWWYKCCAGDLADIILSSTMVRYQLQRFYCPLLTIWLHLDFGPINDIS